MSEGIVYADIIILALVAGFILLRLRGVLGQHSDDEPSVAPKKEEQSFQAAEREAVVQIAEKLLKPKPQEPQHDPAFALLKNPDDKAIIQAIVQKDPQFSLSAFVSGAKLAFEMVFDAFAKSDKQTLSMLLSEELMEHFSRELQSKDTNVVHTEATLLSVTPAAISAVVLDRSIVRITVDFVSEQVTLVRGEDGQVIEGNASLPVRVEEDWTFERDITSRNPNWRVIET